MVSIEKTWIWKSFRHGVRYYELSRKLALNDALLFPDTSEFARSELRLSVTLFVVQWLHNVPAICTVGIRDGSRVTRGVMVGAQYQLNLGKI